MMIVTMVLRIIVVCFFFYFEDAESMGEKVSRISMIFLHFSENACIKNTV